MLTGVIFAAIVVAWAGYLLPTALRRHDQASRARSIDRFSSAMRVLARRTTMAGGRVVVAPPRTAARVLGPDPVEVPEPTTVRVRPTREALQAAAARRRRVLIGLGALTIVVLAVAVAGVLPLWAVVVPGAFILTFLAAARRSVRRASEDYWVEVAAEPSTGSNVVRRAATRVEAESSTTDSASDSDGEPTIGLSRTDLAAAAFEEPQRMVAVTVKTAEGNSLWDPLPVTLPSYVDAPAAKRTVRTIDLGSPDTWSSGHEPADESPATAAGGPDGAAATGQQAASTDPETGGEEQAQVVNG